MRVREIVCCVMLLGIASMASAQGLTYGAKAGVNVSTLAIDSDEGNGGYDSQVGFIAGGFVTRHLAGRLDLQPEGLFSVKGASADVTGVSGKVRLDYIDVPVLIRYRIVAGGRRSIHVFGGPSFDVLLRARTIADLGNAKIEEDTSDDVERFELGVVGGAGLELGRWIVEGRYTYGISDTDKDTSDDVKIRNRGASMLGGFRF